MANCAYLYLGNYQTPDYMVNTFLLHISEALHPEKCSILRKHEVTAFPLTAATPQSTDTEDSWYCGMKMAAWEHRDDTMLCDDWLRECSNEESLIICETNGTCQYSAEGNG